MQTDDNYVDFSDLPTLPPEHIRLLGHIIRSPDIRLSELVSALSDSSNGPSLSEKEITEILDELQKKHLLSLDETNGETTYRARMRRKTARVMTIQGIWNALDSDLDENMHSEMRRVRSELADSMLADLSREEEYDYNPPPENPEQAKQAGQSLLSDLANAGRSSMSRREGLTSDSRGLMLNNDIASNQEIQADAGSIPERNQVLDDPADRPSGPTGIHPNEDEERPSLRRRLTRWFGLED